MEIVKRTKLRYLSQVVSKVLVKSFYIWKISTRLPVSGRCQVFNVGKKYNEEPKHKPVVAGRNRLNSGKISSSDSLFEELKNSLISKARPKEKKSDLQDWESFIFGESGKEEIKKKICHKRSSTGNV